MIDELNNSEPTFRSELSALINKYSKENGSGTPDFILADYLINCLEAYDSAVYAKDEWNRPVPREDIGIAATGKVYIPVGDMSPEEARGVLKNLKRGSDGVIKLKDEK